MIIDSTVSEHVIVHKELFELAEEVNVVQLELEDGSMVADGRKG